MRQLKSMILLAGIALAAAMWNHHANAPGPVASSSTESDDAHGSVIPDFLPPEARGTLDRIARDGPFEHSQDGAVFGNYEGLLPKQPRGYYHEYTVETPGAGTRGAKRIITGGTPPIVYYYTDDHYRSFRRFGVDR